jgi:hypothetical protein
MKLCNNAWNLDRKFISVVETEHALRKNAKCFSCSDKKIT